MRFTVLLCALALSACGQVNLSGTAPEVTACEYMARELLPLPQSYKRLSASSWPESLTREEMEDIRGMVPAVMNGRPGLLTASVEYEYRTNDGGTFNGVQICQFPTRDGEAIGGPEGMMSQAKSYVTLVQVGAQMKVPVIAMNLKGEARNGMPLPPY